MSIWAITEHNHKDVTISLVVYCGGVVVVGGGGGSGIVKVKPEFTYIAGTIQWSPGRKHANKHTDVLIKNTKRSTCEG